VDETMSMARSLGVACAVVAFTPHPSQVLSAVAYHPLFTQGERAFLLEKMGVDYLLEFPFDAHIMGLRASQFADILYNDLQARMVVTGEDFRFGVRREGSVADLRAVQVVQDCEGISTSAIRALLGGDVPQLSRANEMLGFPYFAMGTVTQGRKLGRNLGFPTLNLHPSAEKFLPRYGVYATQTTLDRCTYKSVTNIGLRPTVNADETMPTIETHLFDYDGDAYGLDIRVEFLRYIREERRFENFDALISQIKNDAHEASK
jgi:riboflavin kinase/FMN adenylyltransferase